MRTAVALLFLALSVLLMIPETEAQGGGLLERILAGILGNVRRSTARPAVDVGVSAGPVGVGVEVGERVGVGVTVGPFFGLGLTVGRRSVRSAEKIASPVDCGLEKILQQYGCDVEGAGGLTKEAGDALFEYSDRNHDKMLDDEEKKTLELMLLTEILRACSQQQASSDNKVL